MVQPDVIMPGHSENLSLNLTTNFSVWSNLILASYRGRVIVNHRISDSPYQPDQNPY